MSRIAKVWLWSALAFVIYAILIFLAPWPLHLEGRDAWLLRGGLWLLGLVVAGTIVWYLISRIRSESAPEPLDVDNDEMDAAVAAAQQRLAASKVAGGAKLGALPAVLVFGPQGSTKTTVLLRSGLEPELLAGEALRGDQTVPTRLVNLWYARGAVFAEAAGAVTGDEARRRRFLTRMRATSIGAALGRGALSSRVAVVCFPCDEFLKPGSTENVPAAARQLRAALVEAAEVLGIRLPVYVLFTKVDRVPGFADYVQNLSRDEAREVLGASLPTDQDGTGTYAERESARLAHAFRGIFESLASRRLMVLPRENAAERKPGAYEFPREIRKLAPLATQFLMELGRPSQLAVSPFVRGFYFTGVRAVYVTEQGSVAPQAAAGGAPAAASGATGVFSAARAAQQPAASVPAAAVTKKKPQWVFLERVFPEVVLADRAALQATQGGTRVSGARRAMFAAAALLFLAVGIGFTSSWIGNRGLVNDTRDAAERLATLTPAATEAAATGTLPDLSVLTHLDSLRMQVARLNEYEEEGAPLRLRWGLYTGERIRPDARQLYFGAFDQLMMGETRDRLRRILRSLSDSSAATTDYGPTYDALKAYLIAGGHAERSDTTFLSPVLLRTWIDGRSLDEERLALANRQFDFYARELLRGDPYAVPADEDAVTRGREFLAQFEGTDRIYQFMTSEASRAHASVQFNRSVPGSAAYVVDSYEVPGAYTKGGYDFMQGALANVDRYLKGEEWVLGPDRARGEVDRARVARELRMRYERDYMDHWRAYLRNASVVRYGGLKDAAQKLQALSGPQSPLLAMFALAAWNTGLDSTSAVTRAFQPVHAVTPPTITDRYVSDANTPYVQALAGLAAAVDGAANAPPGGAEGAAQMAAGSASQARLAVNQIAVSFAIDTVAHVEGAVQQLMLAPITAVEGFLKNAGSGELNQAGARFCAAYNQVFNKYPFNPDATVDATMDEVAGLFKPGTGLMWQFYDDVLARLLARQGQQVVPRPGSPVATNPAFVSFFNKASALSAALFANEDPRILFSLRPVLSDAVPGVTVVVDDQVARFTRAANDPSPIQWQPRLANTARISGQFGGSEVNFLGPYNGTWALFKLFHRADRWSGSGGSYTVEWALRTQGQQMTLADGTPVKLTVEINLGNQPAIFQRGYFNDMRCVATVAR